MFPAASSLSTKLQIGAGVSSPGSPIVKEIHPGVAAALFEECCDAEVCPGIVDVYPKVKEAVTITLRPERVCALAGAQIPSS